MRKESYDVEQHMKKQKSGKGRVAISHQYCSMQDGLDKVSGESTE